MPLRAETSGSAELPVFDTAGSTITIGSQATSSLQPRLSTTSTLPPRSPALDGHRRPSLETKRRGGLRLSWRRNSSKKLDDVDDVRPVDENVRLRRRVHAVEIASVCLGLLVTGLHLWLHGGCSAPATCALLLLCKALAFFAYPSLVLLFLTKCHALRTLLSSSYLSIRIPFHDLHQLHRYAGTVCAVAGLLHALAHLVRWGLMDRLRLVVVSQVGLTGLAMVFVIPLIVLPMAWEVLRKRIKYEIRMGFHKVGALGFGVALALHARAPRYVIGITLAIYALDVLYCSFVLTYKVESSVFHRLEQGVQLSFEAPPGFKHVTGYVYVNVPWISEDEWHPFSAYMSGSGQLSVCIGAAGDWSRELHAEVEYETKRPCYVCGPFVSPYATAMAYDNQILVATGFGITPALDVIAYAGPTRRVNLIWITNDASLVEFYLGRVTFDDDAFTYVCYTGKRRLFLEHVGELPATVLLFFSRPDLDRCVRGMIYAIETRQGLPEDLVEESLQLKHRACEEVKALDGGDDVAARAFATLRMLCQRALCFSSVAGVREVFFTGMAKGAETLDAGALQHGARLYGGHLCDDEADALVASFADRVDPDGVLPREAHIGKALFRKFLEDARHELTDAWEQSQSQFGSSRSLVSNSTLGGYPSATGLITSSSLGGYPGAGGGADDGVVDRAAFLKECGGRLHNWTMMYCGGSAPVSAALTKVAERYRLSYREESFAW